MALIEGTNSYVGYSDVDNYFDNRVDASLWLAADNVVQEQALTTAFEVLDGLSWKGYVIEELQATSWPRKGAYYDASRGRNVIFDTSIPERVKKGQMELAFHYIANPGVTVDRGNVLSLDVGAIGLATVSSPRQLPRTVLRFISTLLVDTGRDLVRTN